MKITSKVFRTILIGSTLCVGLMLSSCSNKPTDEELRQLASLKAEVAQLQLEIESKSKEKEDLEKAIKDKKAKLQAIIDEQKSADTK